MKASNITILAGTALAVGLVNHKEVHADTTDLNNEQTTSNNVQQPYTAAKTTTQSVKEQPATKVSSIPMTSAESQQPYTTAKTTTQSVKEQPVTKVSSIPMAPAENQQTVTFSVSQQKNAIPVNALQENKSEVTGNGGYDQATWGTLDLSNWQWNGNNIIGYTGDQTHIIIPNSVDVGHDVLISANEMRNLFQNASTLAISKTGGGKVIASDTEWSNEFSGDTNHNISMDLSNLDTSNINNMGHMFYNASKLTNIGNLGNWNTGNVKYMDNMFNGASSLTNIGNLDNWNTGNVIDMNCMFQDASNLTNIGNLDNWNTGNVMNMGHMFYNASKLTNIGNLGNWNTGNVKYMDNMFNGASSLTNIGDLGNWNTSKVINMSDMFEGASALQKNEPEVTRNGGYDQATWGTLDLSNWQWNGNNIIGYTGDQTHIIIPNSVDVGHDVLINGFEMSNLFNNNVSTLAISKTGGGKVITSDTDWSYEFSDAFNEHANHNISMDLSNLDTSNITNMSHMFNMESSLTTVGNLGNWNTGNVTNMKCMFQDASKLTNIGNLGNWDTGNVKYMDNMFNGASGLTNIGNLDNWNTGNVIDMNCMFQDASNLTNIGDLSHWQTGNVKYMDNMFSEASGLANIGNLGNWQTGNVTNMQSMFQNASNLTNIGDLSHWQTGNVTNMSFMFQNTSKLTNIGNLGNWNTGNVTNMSFMFNGASGLTNIGNLDNWNTGNVIDMNNMFSGASGLANIGNLGNWNTGNVTNMNNMFFNASKLTNIGNLGNWNTSNVIDMSFMFSNTNSSLLLNISNWDCHSVNYNNYNFFDYNGANVTIANDIKNFSIGKSLTDQWMSNQWMFSNGQIVLTNNQTFLQQKGLTDTITYKLPDGTMKTRQRSLFYDDKTAQPKTKTDVFTIVKPIVDAENQQWLKDNNFDTLYRIQTPNTTDPNAYANGTFILVPIKISTTVNYVDLGGKVLATKPFTAMPNQLLANYASQYADNNLLTNYVLAEEQNLNGITITKDNNVFDILVVPKVTPQIINHTVTRTITINLPNSSTPRIINQAISFTKTDYMQQGTVAYSTDWQPDGQSVFAAYVPAIINGYITEIAPSVNNVTVGTVDSNVTLNYKPIQKVQLPLYIDASGKTYTEKPADYQIATGQTPSQGAMLIVKPVVITPKVPQFYTRTVTLIMPSGNRRTINQRVIAGQNFNQIHLPKLRGYKTTITGSIDSVKAEHDCMATVIFS